MDSIPKFIIFTLISALVVFCTEIELSGAEECKACVPLTPYNFDKIVPKFKATIVKFDVAFPYGQRHDEYIKLGTTTRDALDLLVGEVGIKDFGNKDNSELGARFNVNKSDYPAVLLFVQGRTEPYRFETESESDFTAENLKRFVRKKTDIYLGLPGCVEKLDRLAEEFKTADPKDRQAILKKAQVFEETLPEEQQPAAKVYVKTMERILERGDVFVQTEHTRLEGLLKGKMSEQKKRTMEERRNILQSFTHRDEL